MLKSLEQKRDEARAEIEHLDRLIEIKEFIVQKLTDDDGQVIDTQLEFEFNGVKVSIKKSKVRSKKQVQSSSTPPKKSKATTHKKKQEAIELSEAMITSLSEISFANCRKKEAIAHLEEQVSGFSGLHWDHFKLHFKDTLHREGQGAGSRWSFNSVSD
jgi:hypothetical protein